MNKFILIILSLFSSYIWADASIETIQINHRPAQDVLPEVIAFLPENASARAFSNMIIIKADPATISDVKQLINKLDTPPQRLKLSLLKTATKLVGEQQSHWQGDVVISEDVRSASVAVKKWSTQTDTDSNATYQAQGIAGLPIKLTMGQLIPQSQQDVFLRFNGDVVVQSSTEYIPINNGFEAIATVLPNNQVSIEIYPQFSSYSRRHGRIDRTQVITTISGPAATWLELAHINNNANFEQAGTKHYQTHQQQDHYIYIKLEPILTTH
ncbi:MAG: hypothetical protein IBX57_09935 [Gammaproteobacteria bacterium]|nr:hypothetical protein [Gammaproteobacteria bacterium]